MTAPAVPGDSRAGTEATPALARALGRALTVVGAAALLAGMLTRQFVEPISWSAVALFAAVCVATRIFGIALPGKWFASLIGGAAAASVAALGWPLGGLVTGVAVFLGDRLHRRHTAMAALEVAGHMAVATTVGGGMYAVMGGNFGHTMFEPANLPLLAMLFALVPLIANSTVFLQMRFEGTLGRVNGHLTLRWELAAAAIATVLGGTLLGLWYAALPPIVEIVLAGVWLVLAGFLYWLMGSAVRADALTLAQQVTRAIGARTEFAHAFADMRRLTGALVPWHQMGVAQYDEATDELVILAETSASVPAGHRLGRGDALTCLAMEQGHAVTERALGAEARRRGWAGGSEIIVPLQYGGRMVGVWSVRHDAERMYWKNDAELLGFLAPPLALALALSRMVQPVFDASGRTAEQAVSIGTSAHALRSGAEHAAASARRMAETVRALSGTLAAGAEASRATRTVAETGATDGEATAAAGRGMLDVALGMRAESAGAASRLTSAAAVVQEGTIEVTRLGEISDTVEQFRLTIGDLAYQSGLLALNAAIEAARAGEHGRGFAIVADEVRALADRSVAEAAGIARSVAEIRSALERATTLMNRTRADVLAVAETAGGLLGRFDQIVAAAEEVAGIGERIAGSSRETARGSAGLADALAQAAEDARRAAAETEQLVRTSADQSRAVEALNTAAAQLDATARHLAGSAAAARAGGESSLVRTA